MGHTGACIAGANCMHINNTLIQFSRISSIIWLRLPDVAGNHMSAFYHFSISLDEFLNESSSWQLGLQLAQ